MAYKDLLTIVTRANGDAAFAVAETIAARWPCHVAGLHVAELPQMLASANGAELWADVTTKIRADNAADRARVSERMRKFDPPGEMRSVETFTGAIEDTVAYNALHADLVIMERSNDPLNGAVQEAVLFKSGRPLLLAPTDWRGGRIGRRILVAWSAKREAARALADAAPLLEGAEQVAVVTVDAKPPFGASSPPGVDIAAHLARRGVDVDLRHVDGLGRAAEDALIDEARAIDADLIVMGGYGHSRLRQFVFGGVTRALMERAPLPLFLSH